MQFEDFDNRIKDAADNHHPTYDEKAWDKMEALLDKHMPLQEKKEDVSFSSGCLRYCYWVAVQPGCSWRNHGRVKSRQLLLPVQVPKKILIEQLLPAQRQVQQLKTKERRLLKKMLLRPTIQMRTEVQLQQQLILIRKLLSRQVQDH